MLQLYRYISDRGCLGADSREPSPSSQNLLRVGRAHILESLKPEYYERAPPATLLTSGGPDATERVLELKIVILSQNIVFVQSGPPLVGRVAGGARS